MFVLSHGCCWCVYFGLHGLLATRFGRVLVAVRENEQRVEFLGYDARLHKLVAFSIGGALAGLAGCLFVAWGNYVSPTVFSVVQSAQIIIWIMVGGAGTLLGPVIGAVGDFLADRRNRHPADSSMPMSCSARFLLIFVLLVPKGIAPMITRAAGAVARLAAPDLPLPASPR